MAKLPHPDPRGDAKLLEAWRAGDRTAGDRLMQRHYRRVLRFFELRASFFAEDLAQRTFLACLEAAASYRAEGSFRAFLFGIARLQYLEHRRRSGRSATAIENLGPPSTARRTTVSTLMARRQEHVLLLHAMAELPDRLLYVVQLHYWEAMTAAEVGEALDIPRSTVTTRLARARELLARSLRRLARRPALADSVVERLEHWMASVVSPTELTLPDGTR